MREIVWLNQYRRYGIMIRRDAYYSLVLIDEDQELLVENDEIEELREHSIEFTSDNDL